MILPTHWTQLVLADPVTVGLGVASLATAAAGTIAAASAKPKTPATPIPATPATPSAQPATPPTATQQTGPSFLSAASTIPQVSQPGKTLLGQ